MLQSASYKVAFALFGCTIPGGRHNDLSKMHGIDGGGVATRLFAGVHGVSLHQLRADFRSADRAESSRTASGKPASPRCSVKMVEGQQACSVVVDDLPLRPDRGMWTWRSWLD